MENNFKSVSEVFSKDKAFKNVRDFAKQHGVLDEFHTIFPELKKFTEAKKIERGVLFLVVKNSVLRNELKFKTEQLKNKINVHFKEEIVKSIKFTAY